MSVHNDTQQGRPSSSQPGREPEITDLAHVSLSTGVDFIRKAFGSSQALLYQELAAALPGARWDWTLLMRCDKQIASHMMFVPRQMSLGVGSISAALIGWTSTLPKYRNRGFMAALMQRGLQALIDERVALCCVIGVPDLYERFDFTGALADDRLDPPAVLDLKSANVGRVRPRLVVRPMAVRDIPDVARLYRATYGHQPGSFARNRAHWNWLVRGWVRSQSIDFDDLLVLADETNKAAGYAVIARRDPNGVALWEACSIPQLNGSLMEAILVRARDLGASNLRIKLPLGHPLMAPLLVRGARLYGHSFAALARIIHLESLGESLAAAMTLRLARQLPAMRGTIRLVTDIGKLPFEVRRGRIGLGGTGMRELAVLEVPQRVLVKLVFGHISFKRALDYRDVRARGDSTLLERMFPRADPVIPLLDGGQY
jgi:predicted N-acetyltransferase YhbS